LEEDATPEWGIGMVYRVATIPYVGDDSHLGSFVPLIFYEDDLLFIRGTSGGITPLKNESWAFSLMGRLRFMDLPDELFEMKFSDDLFMGAQLRYHLQADQNLDLEFLTDSHGRMISNFRWSGQFSKTKWRIEPFAQIQLKSKVMNSFYYGLDQEKLDEGFEISAGITTRYHLFKNLYLRASAAATFLDQETTSSQFIEDTFSSEFSIGLSLEDDPGYEKDANLDEGPRPYWRLAHGLGNMSNVAEILVGDVKRDPYDNQLTSVFYGFPLSDSLFGLPIDTYLTIGAVWHWESEVQDSGQEVALGVKFYYTLPFPWRFRLGFAEGVSYISKPTYIEYENYDGDFEPSNWQNYLDFSIDMNLGDVFTESLEHLWLGFGIHHRSAVFGSSQQFGRSNAGSNYNTLYLQIDL